MSKSIPIAARIKAEPGWRAVVFVQEGEVTYIKVLRVAEWGMRAPEIVPPAPAPVAVLKFMGAMFGSIIPSNEAPVLWPLDETGAFIPHLHRLVPPSDETAEHMLADAERWLEAVAAAEAKRKPPEVSP